MDLPFEIFNAIGLDSDAWIVSSDFKANPSICELEYGGILLLDITSSFRTQPLDSKPELMPFPNTAACSDKVL